MSKCLGCGIKLQTEDREKIGYSINLENNICERCFRLKHYGEYKNVTLDNKDYQEIINNIPMSSLVVFVADFLTLDLSNIKLFPNMLLVLTKRDILPKSIKDEKIIKRLKENNSKFLDIISVSSIKNYNIDYLYNTLIKYSKNKDIYLIGNTNSGKSTLINTLIKNYGNNNKELITVSMYPSTTLDKVEIKLGDLKLIDTPGLIDEGNYTNIVSSNELKQITPKREIKPRSCQVAGKGSLLIGTYARIDYETKDKNSFVVYTAPTVTSSFISFAKNTYRDGISHKYMSLSNEDVVLPGLGFIKFTKPIDIVIYTKEGIKTYRRDNLI